MCVRAAPLDGAAVDVTRRQLLLPPLPPLLLLLLSNRYERTSYPRRVASVVLASEQLGQRGGGMLTCQGYSRRAGQTLPRTSRK